MYNNGCSATVQKKWKGIMTGLSEDIINQAKQWRDISDKTRLNFIS